MATRAPLRDAASTPGSAGSPAETQGLTSYEHRHADGGPRGRLLSGVMGEYGADPVEAMRRWRDEHGDFVPHPVRAVPRPRGLRSGRDRGGPRRPRRGLPEELRHADADPAARTRSPDRRGRRVAAAPSAGVAGVPSRARRGLRPDDGRLHPGRRRLVDRRRERRPSRRDDGADAPHRRADPLRHRRHRPDRGGRPTGYRRSRTSTICASRVSAS